MRRLNAFLMLLFYSAMAFAVHHKKQPPTGVGALAQQLTTGPINFASTLLNASCFLVGGSFLLASMVKYVEHRRSPLMITMSTVVFLFLSGVVLVAIPILTSDYVQALLH